MHRAIVINAVDLESGVIAAEAFDTREEAQEWVGSYEQKSADYRGWVIEPSASLTEVKEAVVEVETDNFDEDITASIEINYQGNTFTAWCADELPLAMWREIADGTPAIYHRLYQGNGEGSIRVNDEGSTVEMTGAPSGAGGDVSAVIRIPVSALKRPLHEGLDKLVELGVQFRADWRG